METAEVSTTFPFISGQAPMNKSYQLNELATALAEAQGEMEAAKKGEEGYGYNYSDLATVIATAKPILAKHGLAVTQLVGNTVDGAVSITTILTHKSGQFIESNATLPMIDMKGCNAAQNAGASLSYLRRYAYQAIIGQPSEDNDASPNGFSKPANKASRKAASPSAAKKEESGDRAERPKKSSFRKNKVK